MKQEIRDVINLFGAFVASMKNSLTRTIDMSADLIYGQGISPQGQYSYVAIPIRSLKDDGLDKESLDKLFSIMAFFVDNTIGEANIYLTTRDEKLVIEIAW